MQWIIDDSIALTEILTAARWNWKTCITNLVAAGLTEADANLYAGWAFGFDPMYQRSVSEDSLTPEQYDRISIRSSSDSLHPAPPNI